MMDGSSNPTIQSKLEVSAPNTESKVLTHDTDTKVLVHEHFTVDDQYAAVIDSWDPAKVRRLYLKIDFHLLPILALLYLIRGALANASILGIKTDLNMDTTKYNLLATVFLFTYSIFEIPANVALSKMRPSLWIAIITFAWGAVTTLSGIVKNYAAAIVCRLFLGIFEAGFFPGAVFLVSMWYPRDKMQFRISIFFCMGALSGSFSGLIAYGVAHMDGAAGVAAWRWLFILLGIVTVAFSFVIKWVLPDYPATARWLTPEEKQYLLAINMISGDGGRSGGHFNKADLVAAAKDIKIWMCGSMGVGCTLPLYGFSYSLPSVLVQLGYTRETAQLMTVPLYAVGTAWTVVIAFTSDRIGRRAPGILVSYGIALVGLICQFALPKTRMAAARYGCLFFIPAGLYAALPGTLSWQANNAAPRGKRAMSTALTLSIGNISAAIGTNIYLGSEAPDYKTGYSISIVAVLIAILCAAFLRWHCANENSKKDRITVDHTPEELEAMGDKSPLFKYIM